MARRNTKTPQFKFNSQKQSAKVRGIEWLLTFEEWWATWEASGKWERRGCKRGQYCMARHGDIGPYSIDNVSIIEYGANASAALKGKTWKWGDGKKAKKVREQTQSQSQLVATPIARIAPTEAPDIAEPAYDLIPLTPEARAAQAFIDIGKNFERPVTEAQPEASDNINDAAVKLARQRREAYLAQQEATKSPRNSRPALRSHSAMPLWRRVLREFWG